MLTRLPIEAEAGVNALGVGVARFVVTI